MLLFLSKPLFYMNLYLFMRNCQLKLNLNSQFLTETVNVGESKLDTFYSFGSFFRRELGGDEVPPSWAGRLNITYRLGPGFINPNRLGTRIS